MSESEYLKEINRLITGFRDFEDFCYESLMSIIDLIDVQRVSLWRLDDSNSKIECQVLLDKHKGALIEITELSEVDFPAYFEALKSGEAIVANDAKNNPATSEFTDEYLVPNAITSMLDIPIIQSNIIVGIICCEHCGDVRKWQEDEIDFVFEIAKLVEEHIEQ